MWVKSKLAAEILGVKYETVKKATQRAEKAGKKFCVIGCNKSHFTYIPGIGRGGKTLRIWLDDEKTENKTSEKAKEDVVGNTGNINAPNENIARAISKRR